MSVRIQTYSSHAYREDSLILPFAPSLSSNEMNSPSAPQGNRRHFRGAPQIHTPPFVIQPANHSASASIPPLNLLKATSFSYVLDPTHSHFLSTFTNIISSLSA